MLLPDPVDDDSSCEWVVRMNERLRQPQPSLAVRKRLRVVTRELADEPGLDEVTSIDWIAAPEDSKLARRFLFDERHRSRRRTGRRQMQIVDRALATVEIIPHRSIEQRDGQLVGHRRWCSGFMQMPPQLAADRTVDVRVSCVFVGHDATRRCSFQRRRQQSLQPLLLHRGKQFAIGLRDVEQRLGLLLCDRVQHARIPASIALAERLRRRAF